jgi:hypothetical protein
MAYTDYQITQCAIKFIQSLFLSPAILSVFKTFLSSFATMIDKELATAQLVLARYSIIKRLNDTITQTLTAGINKAKNDINILTTGLNKEDFNDLVKNCAFITNFFNKVSSGVSNTTSLSKLSNNMYGIKKLDNFLTTKEGEIIDLKFLKDQIQLIRDYISAQEAKAQQNL